WYGPSLTFPLSARLGNLPTNMKSEPLRWRRRKNPHGADRVEAARQQGEPRTVVLRGLCGPRRLEIYEHRNAVSARLRRGGEPRGCSRTWPDTAPSWCGLRGSDALSP